MDRVFIGGLSWLALGATLEWFDFDIIDPVWAGFFGVFFAILANTGEGIENAGKEIVERNS